MKNIEPVMGIINLAEMNTSPGNNNPFSPPHSWSGDNDDYIELMRNRNHTRAGYQQIYVAAKIRIVESNVSFYGPYKDVADKMLNSLCNNILNSN